MSALTHDVTLIAGVLMVVGLVGTVVPILPGPLLIAGALVLWAVVAQTTAGWVVLAAALALLAAGQVLKYLTAGRTLTASGVPNSSLLLAGVLGLVGFFVVPVLGLVIGFVLGLFLAERRRLGAGPGAWASTRTALKAVGIGLLIELGSATLAVGTWFVAVLNGAG